MLLQGNSGANKNPNIKYTQHSYSEKIRERGSLPTVSDVRLSQLSTTHNLREREGDRILKCFRRLCLWGCLQRGAVYVDRRRQLDEVVVAAVLLCVRHVVCFVRRHRRPGFARKAMQHRERGLGGVIRLIANLRWAEKSSSAEDRRRRKKGRDTFCMHATDHHSLPPPPPLCGAKGCPQSDCVTLEKETSLLDDPSINI